ncbi:2-amino-4-hydroxy-6-hydroxymethyldihydropteridine diphosphokinase [Rhabdochromatium marinum]|uniref:2-amino-4-hydroxy-6- hydroxymethyldihydropteridine diphosphokinase n=1 Tax=Rhabdochromatium marinum TaxID=48729 RepID=UPI001907B9A8|nr:2-amino-4-hydroxy-6-hydroxymethyldihydropteridine diphosphokinase [Rhabdochromatium marinum]MBK1649363.1 2-amino-4-hydroxy-6-hydroxymethyldihydropteridine diphosphokinase [Rhabdochromatium marinum]
MSERTLYLSIGSNIQPEHNVKRCLASLRALSGATLTAVSNLYRTRPWGGATQAEFINLAVALRTSLPARTLLAQMQAIEQALGRERLQKNGARTIDIDLLLLGDEVHQDAALCVPHPGLLERDFMLLPLLEIAPEACHPVTGEPLMALSQGVRYRQIIERLPALD